MSGPSQEPAEERERLCRVIDLLAECAKERVSDPRNVAKGGWSGMTDGEIEDRISEEHEEFVACLRPEASLFEFLSSPDEGGDLVAFYAMWLDNHGWGRESETDPPAARKRVKDVEDAKREKAGEWSG